MYDLDPTIRPTISVEEAGEILGISRAAAFKAAHTGELPSIRIGRSIRVPTAALLRLLAVDTEVGA
jgi:excisionase family DNA binding protein